MGTLFLRTARRSKEVGVGGEVQAGCMWRRVQ